MISLTAEEVSGLLCGAVKNGVLQEKNIYYLQQF